MNKKILSLLGVCVIALTTGCGANNSTPTQSNTPTPSVPNSTSSIISSSREITDLPTEDGWFYYMDELGNEYEGQFVNGLYNGYGTMLYADSTMYEGTWVDGVKEGSGKIYWNSGCLYVGEMHDDLMHGAGYMLYPMGDYYYGDFKYGQITGYGTKAFLRDATGATHAKKYDIYTGEMKDGYLHGYGTMQYYFGGVFTGNYEMNIRTGYGVYIWEETDDPNIPWTVFEGNFANDWISGEGTLYFKDGTSKTGTFDGNALPLTAE